jgi:hypothetical protein
MSSNTYQAVRSVNPNNLHYEAALEAATEGKALQGIAAALGCTARQLRTIRENNPEFNAALLRAREDGFYSLADELLTIVEDKAEQWDANLIKVKCDNIKWYLSKMHHRVFGDKLDVSITEKIDIRAAMLESKARLRVVNPTLIENDSPFD